jgi:hypothetical protein
MSLKDPGSWLFLLFNLSAKQATYRVRVWRQLKKFGAVQLKTSTYVLPDEPVHYKRFQWLAKEIVDSGGEAALVRVKDIESMPHAAVVAMFNEGRTCDYDVIAEALTRLMKDGTGGKAFVKQLQKLRNRYEEIRENDFFQSSRGEDLQRLFLKAESLEPSAKQPGRKLRLCVADYRGKTWITRPHPEIDRVGSAWLIRNFIDSEAKFVFANILTKRQGALPYDMIDGEFSHHGDCCTFETLIERFGIRERAVLRLAEIIHDTDLEDEKFHRVEGFGVAQILKGWAKQGVRDEEILMRGFQCFDGLHAQLRRA